MHAFHKQNCDDNDTEENTLLHLYSGD